MTEDNIFLDKIKLSFVVLKKETDLIEVYSSLLKKIKRKYIKVEDVFEWNDYHGSWGISHELYSFLKYNKIKDLNDKKKKEIGKDIDILEKIMDRYEQPDGDVGFEDLQKVVKILQKIVSLSGYHDDKFQDMGADDKPIFTDDVTL